MTIGRSLCDVIFLSIFEPCRDRLLERIAPSDTNVLLTGERDGYYADYADRPASLLGRELMELILAGPTNARRRFAGGVKSTLSHGERVAPEGPGEGMRRRRVGKPSEPSTAASPHPGAPPPDAAQRTAVRCWSGGAPPEGDSDADCHSRARRSRGPRIHTSRLAS